MSFEWNSTKKVEQFDPGSKRVVVGESTPKYIIKNPYGFRQEDIVHSLTLAVAELIDMAEAQARSQSSIQKMIKERDLQVVDLNIDKKEEEEKIDGDGQKDH